MLAVLLGGLSMVSPFSIDTFFPAFHAMERALHVDAWQLQQVLTAYMVPFAFASLVHGPLSDAVGRRPVMIWGMVLYTVGSIACTFAPNYASLIGGAHPAGRDRRRRRGDRPRGGARSVRRRARTAPDEHHHDDLQHRAGGRADHRWLGTRGLRLARGVRVHGDLRRDSGFCGLVEAAGDPSARGAYPVQLRATWSRPRVTVLRNPEFLLLSIAAATNFSSVAVIIGAAPAMVEQHWGHE